MLGKITISVCIKVNDNDNEYLVLVGIINDGNYICDGKSV